MRSNWSRGPKSFLARRMCTAPSAWPDQQLSFRPWKIWQTKRIITAQSVLDAQARAGSSRQTRSVRRAREYLVNASTETARWAQKLACALVTASTERSNASLLPRRRGTSSKKTPNDHQRLYLRSVDRSMLLTKALDNRVRSFPGHARGAPKPLLELFGDRYASWNLYRRCPEPRQIIPRRVHLEQAGCFSSHL